MKKLIIHKMSIDVVPPGGGVGDALKFLTGPVKGITSAFSDAAKWCDSVIAIIRQAAAPNPWVDASEEEIAGELLRQIDERKRSGK